MSGDARTGNPQAARVATYYNEKFLQPIVGRTIKFRTWNRLKNTMWVSNDMPASLMKLFWSYGPFMEHQCPPMQFTGFTDSNGTEIFECDILACPCDESSARVVVVAWDGDEGRWSVGDGRLNRIIAAHSTVIGNIYETPGLESYGALVTSKRVDDE